MAAGNPSLAEWLGAIQLGAYYDAFLAAGFDNLGQLLVVHMGDFRITDEILRDELGMGKIGHVRKLIMKLDEEVARLPGGRKGYVAPAVEKIGRLEACKKCVIM